MTETTQDLLARLAGFTPGPWGFEKADDECYGYSFWSSDGTNICEFGGEYDNGDQVRGQHPQKYDAALIAAAPDLHRIATEQAAEIARLREVLEDAEYDLAQWVECAPELIKAGFNMDGSADVLAKVSAALDAGK